MLEAVLNGALEHTERDFASPCLDEDGVISLDLVALLALEQSFETFALSWWKMSKMPQVVLAL